MIRKKISLLHFSILLQRLLVFVCRFFIVSIFFFSCGTSFADIKVAVVQAAARTTTGTQDFTSAGFGTPKAAMFIMTRGATNGTAAAHNVFSIGATDGTTERTTSSASDDGVATTDSGRHGNTDQSLFVVQGGGTPEARDGEANFNSWITDGVRINWGNALNDGIGFLITCILFGGSDLSASVNTVTTSALIGGTVDVTDPGFEPDQVITFSHRASWDTGTSGFSDYGMTLGFVDNGASVVQGSYNVTGDDGQATSSLADILSEQYAMWSLNPSDADDAAEFGSFDSDGFTVTTREQASSHILGYLALAYNGAANHWVGFVDSPAATGDDAETGPSFTPQFVMLIGSYATAADTYDNTGPDIGAFMASTFTSSAAYSLAVASEDNVGTSNTQSMADNKAVNFPHDDGTAGFVGTFSSMDASGWTLNFTTVDGTTRKWIGLAIEDDSTSGSGGRTTATFAGQFF